MGGEIKAEKDARKDIRRILKTLVFEGIDQIPYINLEAETSEKHGISPKKFKEILDYYVFNEQITISEYKGIKYVNIANEWKIQDLKKWVTEN